MCINPGTLPNGQQFACRKCEQCRDHYVEDWVGRCIAEGQVSVGWNVVTLSYASEVHQYVDRRDIKIDQRAKAAYLTYKDVQLYLKRLRKNGYPCRYFVVGEYGSKKGRAHWHVVLFWERKVPPHELRKEQWHEPHWPHGFSFWDAGRFTDSVKYALKYIHKTKGDEAAQSKFMMSKKPPLGALYFELLAQRHVDALLPIRDLFYYFPDVRRKNGKPIRFQLARQSADAYLGAYVRRFRATYGHDNWPASEVVDAYLDRQADYVPLFRVDPRFKQARPWKPYYGGLEKYVHPSDKTALGNQLLKEGLFFSQAHNSFFVMDGEKRLFWSFDKLGRRAWLDVIRSEPLEVYSASKLPENGYNEYSARRSGTHWQTKRGSPPKP